VLEATKAHGTRERSTLVPAFGSGLPRDRILAQDFP